MKLIMLISQVALTAFLSFVLVKANASTHMEQDLNQLQTQLRLSPEALFQVREALDNETDKKKKARVLFCVEVGVGAIVDLFSMSCSNLKGKKLDVSFVGLGASLGLHSGVAVLYPKKGSRSLKEGTYRNTSFAAIHLGLGVMGLKFTNDNESINYRARGLTLGAGFNAAGGLILVDDPATAE